jgi:hypothetical protein
LTSVGGGVYSDVRAESGLVYVTTEDGNLVVLDASNGAEQWRASFPCFGNSEPALGNRRVYVTSDRGPRIRRLELPDEAVVQFRGRRYRRVESGVQQGNPLRRQ